MMHMNNAGKLKERTLIIPVIDCHNPAVVLTKMPLSCGLVVVEEQ